jgi:hypothetical protein
MLLFALACVPVGKDASVSCPTNDRLGADGCRSLTVIGTADDGLQWPRDLEFAPDTGLLWVADAAHSGMVIYTDPGTPDQTAELRIDWYAGHFMDTVSSLAFGADNTFATCQESRDDWNDGPQSEDDFMGPTLWDADLDVFAEVGQTDDWRTQEGSHIDMLHQSPLCMGIAHEAENQYWTFDGLDGAVVYYDFREDHGPGGSDHSDGLIEHYDSPTLTRVEGVPGHMVRDPASDWLYIADTGTGRVLRLDTSSGEQQFWNARNTDGVRDFYRVVDATTDVFASGLDEPSGLALAGDTLYVGDHATGEIVAYDLDGSEHARITTGAAGLMGLTVGPDDKLWYVDGEGVEVVRIDP